MGDDEKNTEKPADREAVPTPTPPPPAPPAAPPPAKTPEVSIDDLTKGEGLSVAGGKELEPLSKVGYWLSLFVLGAMVLSTMGIAWVSFFLTPLPAPPPPPSQITAESVAQYKLLIEQYKLLNDIVVQRATQLFQQVVVAAFLPSFTAILGYIFGSRKAE